MLDKDGNSYFATVPQRWGLGSLSLDIIVNTSVTLLIAGQLWYIGRKNSATWGHYMYHATMFTFLKSGGLFASATVVCWGMDIGLATASEALLVSGPSHNLW